VTAITVGGTATGLTSGTVVVPNNTTISLTYSAAPTWAWAPFIGSSGAGDGEVVQVSATAPQGGQAGTIPQATFLPSQVIYADSSAGSTGPQLLYQSIGAGNLRAFVDGQDNVGHAALSN
jgi:hypothetical protein